MTAVNVNRLRRSTTGVNVRNRVLRLSTRPQPSNSVLEPLFRAVRANHPQADLALLKRAYAEADKWHRGQMRKSGDPYITHPLAVTKILADIGMTEPTLVAALLHDTVEDTPYTLEALRADFGDEVALLVDGVAKLDEVEYSGPAQAETLRKMIVAMSRDIRVLVIKLADRLHDMRTLRYLPAASQERFSRETLDIYAPLAHRLGMNALKWESEDLAFANLQPKIYDEVVRLVAEHAPSRNRYIADAISDVEEDLRVARIRATVTGRLKSYYSIYQKMIVGGRDISEIYDLVGIRILVDEDRDCYSALGLIHSRWDPVLGRFKDYVAMPKFNMYQSLHTTVIGHEGKPVEFQIRTLAQHRRAEYGVAAEWKYAADKRSGRDLDPPASKDDLTWLRQLLDWQTETDDPGEFLESLRFELNAQQVYVFTPRGDTVTLPIGATAVDFAYAVHTEVGHHAVGAQVNGTPVELSMVLDHGDVIEVFTSEDPLVRPQRLWLTHAASRRARRHIRRWYRQLPDVRAAKIGDVALSSALMADGLPRTLLSKAFLGPAAAKLGYNKADALTAAVGRGMVDVSTVISALIEVAKRERVELSKTQNRRGSRGQLDPSDVRKAFFDGNRLAVVRDLPATPLRFAKCCNPEAGGPIVALWMGRGIASIHKSACARLSEHDDVRILPAAWVGEVGAPQWARSTDCDVLVTTMPLGLARPDLNLLEYSDRVVSARRRSVGADGTEEYVVTLRVEGAGALASLLRDLTTRTDVSAVELLGRDYTTLAESKRARYRGRRNRTTSRFGEQREPSA